MDLHRRRWTRTRGPLHRGSALFTAGALVASLLLSSLAAGTALAADSGAKAPTTTPNPNQWSSATNAYSSNNVYATESSDNDEQGYGGFGLAVPAGSTIAGITVKVEAKSSEAAGCLEVTLVASGASTQTAALTTTDQIFTFGGTWGRTWDATEVNALVVRVRHQESGSACSNGTTSVDSITVAVTYSTFSDLLGQLHPATGVANLPSDVCKQADFGFVVDRSGSIGAASGADAAEKNGIKGFVDAFQGMGGSGLYAGTRFGGSTATATTFTSGFIAPDLFKTAVDGLPGTNGRTPTGAGIATGSGNAGNNRVAAPNIMFVVTDGSPNVPWSSTNVDTNYPEDAQGWLVGANAAIDAANAARAAGWFVKAIFVGAPDTGLPFSSADDLTWVQTVMSRIGGGSYTPVGSFNDLASGLLISAGCPTATIAKSNDATAPVLRGATVHYTVTVGVAFGPADVTVSDNLPNSFGAASNFKLDGTSFSPTGTDPLVWAMNDLATGSHQLTYEVVVAADTAAGDYTNTASITSGPPCGDSCSATSTVKVALPLPETGSLQVTKKLTGDLTEFAGGDFTFSVTCDDESYGPVTINLSSGSASASPITGIPAGADCTVNETGKPSAGTYAGWDAPTYSPSAAVPIVSGQQATVEVTNNRTYNPPQAETSISIIKETVGGDGVFGFELAYCADGCGYLDAPETFSISTVDGDGSKLFEDVKPGWYVVEETNLPSGWTLTDAWCDGQDVLDRAVTLVASDAGDSLELYVPDGEHVTCTFENTKNDTPPTPPPSVQIPGIHVEKSASASTVVAGTAVTYTFLVTNASIDALLTNITVSDDKCSPATYVSGDNDGDTFLQIGETWTYTCTTTLTATTTNTVTATGAWRGQTVTDEAQATVTVTPGEVAGATGTPRVTPPPTAAVGSQDSGNPGSTLGVALAALALFGLVLGALAPKPARARRRSR